ncbi:hypothetical protein [Fischerella thermalis]|uniref:hypothetical protein n=1 Tax=Fischerella thermalis TaxID=372787 RepID=UPI0015E0E9F2|nr:hypothetical protein [Fischerella thermalis]
MKSFLLARQPLQNLSCPAASRPCAFRGFLLERTSNVGLNALTGLFLSLAVLRLAPTLAQARTAKFALNPNKARISL